MNKDLLPQNMTLEQLVEQRDQLDYTQKEIQAAMQVFSEEILIRLKAENLNGTVVNDRAISKVTRYSFTAVTFEKAKDLGATKLVADNVALKKIYMKNPKLLPEVEIREGIMIRDVAQKEELPE